MNIYEPYSGGDPFVWFADRSLPFLFPLSYHSARVQCQCLASASACTAVQLACWHT